jgi:hypothetical protein
MSSKITVMNPDPCQYFQKYKAIHKPRCGCLPCDNKYRERLEIVEKFGRTTVVMAESIIEATESKPFLVEDICLMLHKYRRSEATNRTKDKQ